jgi:hypothetical protein
LPDEMTLAAMLLLLFRPNDFVAADAIELMEPMEPRRRSCGGISTSTSSFAFAARGSGMTISMTRSCLGILPMLPESDPAALPIRDEGLWSQGMLPVVPKAGNPASSSKGMGVDEKADVGRVRRKRTINEWERQRCCKRLCHCVGYVQYVAGS